MLQTITQLKTVQNEPRKDYFTAANHPGKLAFLERERLSWQETLDYLYNYWNAGNIKGIGAHLNKEMRRKYFGSVAKILNLASYMETLLLQQKKILWQQETPAQVQGLVSLVVLDRKMRRWCLTAYGSMRKYDEKYLLEDYCPVSMQRIKEVEKNAANEEFFGIISLKRTCANDLQIRPNAKMPYCKKDGSFSIYANEETHQKIVANGELVICCAADKQNLHELLNMAVNGLRLEEMRVCLKDGTIIINEL